MFLVPQSPAASPQKNLTGSPRIVRDISADIYNNIQKWNNLHIEGSHIVKQIGFIKSEIFGSYSKELEQQTDNLYKIVENLRPYVKIFEKLCNQINALDRLQNASEVPFISLKLFEIKEIVEIITAAYLKDYKVILKTILAYTYIHVILFIFSYNFE